MNGIAEINNIVAYYDTHGHHLHVLQNVLFGLSKGEVLAIVGPSGCGKSTLLKIMAGLLRPFDGYTMLNGKIVDKPSRSIGLLFQDDTLFDWLSVYDNVAFAAKALQLRESDHNKWVDFLLQQVDIKEFKNSYPKALSGGMLQRVSLARAFASRPELLLLDEPFNSLDALSRSSIYDTFLSLCVSNDVTSVLVTHDIDEAVTLCDRILLMSSRPGRIVKEFSVQLPRPRIVSGMRREGFEVLRNSIVAAFNDLSPTAHRLSGETGRSGS